MSDLDDRIDRLSLELDSARTQLRVYAMRVIFKDMSSAPRDGTYVELRGPSGYRGYPYRVMIAKYDRDRERTDWNQKANDHICWRTVAGDCVTEDGDTPTHWRPVS